MGSLALIGLSLLTLVATKHPDLVERALWPEPRASIDWVRIPAGTQRPQFAPSESQTEIAIGEHDLADTPVTNADFLHFVQRHPEWRRDRVSRLFADPAYLAHWAAPDELGDAGARRPVTQVSWFAASAFCEAAGARLPTEAEWERVAAESPAAEQLAWYAKPSRGPERDVGGGAENRLSVHDMNGLVWEWVLDFNSNMVKADSRDTTDNDKNTFCGGGALRARDPADYAAFMRIAFRSSLEARFVARHLGFRCARDVEKETR